jgi:hypothetical protein
VVDGQFEAVTYVITQLEVMIQPLRLGRAEVAEAYEALLGDISNLAIVDLDFRAARVDAELRALHGLRTPDAEEFITNDRQLRGVTAIDVRVLANFA